MDLFPESKDFQSSHYIDLDRDSALWDDFITQQVKKVTKDKPVSILIAWNQKDTKKGYAVGSVIIQSTQSGVRIILPILMRDFKLAPLDTLMTLDGKIDTFNQDSIDKYLFDGDVGYKASEKPEQQFASIIPTSFTSDLPTIKTASILTSLIPFDIDEKDWNRVKKELETPEILYKFAGDKGLFVDLFKQKLIKKPERQIEAIRKIGPDSYLVMSNAIENFDPAMEIKKTSEVVEIIETNVPPEIREHAIHELENGGIILDWESKPDSIELVDEQEEPQTITEDGFYRVMGPNGFVDGMYISKSYDPISDRISNTPVFISTQGGGKQQGKPKGYPVSDVKLPISDPGNDETGYFLYIYKSEPVLIGPFTITSIISETFGKNSYNAISESGYKIRIEFSQYVSGFSVLKPERDNTIRNEQKRPIVLTMPEDNCAWVPIKEEWEIQEPKTEKSASVVIKKIEPSKYEVHGVEKRAFSHIEHDIDLAFMLRCFGAPLNKIATILKKAKESDIVKLRVKPIEKKASKNIDLSFVEKKGLTKLASLFEDMTTIDAVLSLNFINKDNIQKFVNALPQFIKTKEELLRMLLISRIGNIEIPENVIKQAIDVIDKVIDGLSKLKARGTE